MTPRALAADTIALLKPLSCHAIAAASAGDTPLTAATWRIVEAPRRVGVGCGGAAGTTVLAGAGSDAWGGAGAPDGSLMTVPASSVPAGSRPFIAAIAATGTRELAASSDSVSPQRTLYAPCGTGALLGVAGATVGVALVPAVAVAPLDAPVPVAGVAPTRPARCSAA